MNWTELKTTTKLINYSGSSNVHYKYETNSLIIHHISCDYVWKNDILDYDEYKSYSENRKIAFFNGYLRIEEISEIINQVEKIKLTKKLNNF